MYPNLQAEMARRNVTQNDIAKYLDRNPVTISGWINGKGGGFSIGAALAIESHFFSGCAIDYLFAQDAKEMTQ